MSTNNILLHCILFVGVGTTMNALLYDLDNSMKFDSSVNHGGNDAIVIRREIYVYYHVFYCYEIRS